MIVSAFQRLRLHFLVCRVGCRWFPKADRYDLLRVIRPLQTRRGCANRINIQRLESLCVALIDKSRIRQISKCNLLLRIRNRVEKDTINNRQGVRSTQFTFPYNNDMSRILGRQGLDLAMNPLTVCLAASSRQGLSKYHISFRLHLNLNRRPAENILCCVPVAA